MVWRCRDAGCSGRGHRLVQGPGVDGLTTIVGESGPYDYYDYTRSNGVIQRGGHYVSSLANTVTDANRRAYCKPVRDTIDAGDALRTGAYSKTLTFTLSTTTP